MRHAQFAVALLLISTSGLAQTSSPTSRPTTRRSIVVPPGFQRVTVGTRVALCEESDQAWVKQAIQFVAPATRPTTMPSDLLARFKEKRELILKGLGQELGIDTTDIATFFDEKLIPSIQQLEHLDPPIFYLVTTRKKLIALLRGGWEDPRFYYNRIADDVSFNTGVTLAIDRELDDTILPALYDADADEAARVEVVAKAVRETEADMINSIAARSQFLVQMGIVESIGKFVVAPLKLSEDQQWFGLGLVGVVCAKFGAEAIGIPRGEIISQMTFEPPRIPVKASSVDLLHPTPLNDLRREYVPFYVDALRRKSTIVMNDWAKKVGDDAIPKVLAAIRKEHPADGPALVRLIKTETGQDLTRAMGTK